MPKNGQCESWRQSLESQVFVVSSAQNKNCHPVRLGSSQWMSPYSTLKIDHNLFGINNKYLPWVLQGAWVFSCFFAHYIYIYLMMGWVGVGWAGMLTFMLRSWCCVDHGVGWDVNVHVVLMMLRWSWGGVGWDVNVHVTLMMLRSEKKCKFWNNRPTGRYSNMCCPFVYFNTDILGLLAQKPSTARINGGRRSKIQSFFQLSTSKGLLLSMLMVLVHGPKLQRLWKFLAFKEKAA